MRHVVEIDCDCWNLKIVDLFDSNHGVGRLLFHCCVVTVAAGFGNLMLGLVDSDGRWAAVVEDSLRLQLVKLRGNDTLEAARLC